MTGSDQEGRVKCVVAVSTNPGVRCRAGSPALADMGLLCKGHRKKLEQQFADIVQFWANLPGVGERTVPDSDEREEKMTKKPFYPSPARLDIIALKDSRNSPVGGVSVNYQRNWNGHRYESNGPDIPDVAGVLGSWCELVTEERSLSGQIPDTVGPLIGMLQTHLDWIVYQSWVDEFFNEMRACRHAVAQAVGHVDAIPLGTCPRVLEDGPCGGDVLKEDGVARCQSCRTSWTGNELVRLKLMQQEDVAASA